MYLCNVSVTTEVRNVLLPRLEGRELPSGMLCSALSFSCLQSVKLLPATSDKV